MHRNMAFLVLVCTLGMLSTTGCSWRAPESIEYKPGPPTIDGLRRVDSEERFIVYLKPGVHLEDFTQVLIDPFSVSYASPRDAPGRAVRTLDPETEQRLADVLRDAFVKEMQLSRPFDLVEQPGPKALRVQGWLYDLVVDEPPSDDPRNFPLCFAEMSVVLTVRHSQTAQALARIGEHAKLSCADNRRALFHTAKWQDVSDSVKPWARFLRRWLEEIRGMAPITDP